MWLAVLHPLAVWPVSNFIYSSNHYTTYLPLQTWSRRSAAQGIRLTLERHGRRWHRTSLLQPSGGSVLETRPGNEPRPDGSPGIYAFERKS